MFQDAGEKEYPANVQNKPTVCFEIFILHDIQGVTDVNEIQEKKHNTTAKRSSEPKLRVKKSLLHNFGSINHHFSCENIYVVYLPVFFQILCFF